MRKKYRNDTEYLLSNPANAKHLMQSIEQDKAKQYAVIVSDLKELRTLAKAKK